MCKQLACNETILFITVADFSIFCYQFTWCLSQTDVFLSLHVMDIFFNTINLSMDIPSQIYFC